MSALNEQSESSPKTAAEPAAVPQVSILIVNFNGRDFLTPCLESLRKIQGPTHEVIVVDNASTDESLSILKSFPEVNVIQSKRNLGFAGGNNLGLKSCRAGLILLLNSDTVVTENFLNPLVEYLENNPSVGVVQGKMLLSRFGDALDVCGSFMTRFGFLYHYGYYKPDGEIYHHSFPVFTGKGACLMFRKKLVESVGGYLFNEDFFCYYEETDFCHRAWIAGYETHFVHDSVIQHFQGGTSEAAFNADYPTRQFLRNQTFALLANLSPASLLTIMPFYFALFFAGMLASLVSLRFALFSSYCGALGYPVRNLGKVLEQRRMIGRIRRSQDGVIFAKVLKTPRLGYFWKTFSGKLRLYEDAGIR